VFLYSEKIQIYHGCDLKSILGENQIAKTTHMAWFGYLVIFLLSFFTYRWFRPNEHAARRVRNRLHWTGCHVIITGGSSGLGLALAEYAAGRGARVSIISRDPSRLQSAQESCQSVAKDNGAVATRQADVTDFHTLTAVIHRACEQYGPPSYVFCCAGFCRPALLRDARVTDAKAMMMVNYMGTFHTVQAALQEFSPSVPCRMVAVTSVCALTTFAGFAGYSPTKVAVRSLWETLRNEYCAEKNLKWHVFVPSTIDSPGLKEEERSKPPVTRLIEGTASKFPPQVAAHHLLEGIGREQYTITQEWKAYGLRILANGTAPPSRLLLDTLITPWVQLAGVAVRFYYDWRVRRM